MEKNTVKLGKITSPKGLKGEVKVISYTQDPLSLKDYKVFDVNGKHYNIISLVYSGKFLVAKIQGVEDRDSAEQLKNIELYAFKDDLPALEEDVFYYVDLEGLKVLDSESSTYLGDISAIYNFGSDDILEFVYKENSQVLSFIFSKENFPIVNIKEGYITIDSLVFKQSIKK